jgi:hypothetical protein
MARPRWWSSFPRSMYAIDRARCEVEAESVAHLVAAVVGLATDTYSFPYVAGWIEDALDDRQLVFRPLRWWRSSHTRRVAMLPSDFVDASSVSAMLFDELRISLLQTFSGLSSCVVVDVGRESDGLVELSRSTGLFTDARRS